MTSRYAHAALLAGMAGFLFLYYLKQIGDYDVWFHLVVGRETLARGLPDKGFYVLPLLDQPERFYEWGYGTLLYLLQRWGDLTALSLFNAALGMGTVLLLLLGRWRDPTPFGRVAGLGAALVVAATLDFRLVLRPEIVLYLALAATLLCLERHRDQSDPRWLVPLPVISLVLANLHPSVFLVLAASACHLLDALWTRRPQAARQLGIVLLAMALAACLNPHGLHQLILPFHFAQDTRLMTRVAEFLPIHQTPALPGYLAILALALPALLMKRTRRIADLLLVACFALLAWRYARNLGLLAIAGYLPLRATLLSLLGSSAARFPGKAVTLAAGLVLAGGLAGLVGQRLQQGDWGTGLRPGVFPSLAAQAAADPGVTRLATLFQYGGYLAWKTGKPVLADGRNYDYNAAFAAHDTLFAGQPGWERVLDEYRIDTLFTPALQPGGRPVPLLANLYLDDRWALAGMDEVGLWFLRSDRVPPGQALDKREIWRRLLADHAARGRLADDPLLQIARRQLGAH
jgi:hypothetical protein